MERLPVYILAGGKSSRFGSDKARAMLNGKSLILRIADSLSPLAASITVVAESEGKYADIGLRTIADQGGNPGPMRGLRSALCDHQSRGGSMDDWIILCSCDLTMAKPSWFEILWKARQPGQRAVAFKNEMGRWEPLMAIYRCDILEHPMWPEEVSRIDSIARLLDLSGVQATPVPSDWPAVLQVNTPADLQSTERGGLENIDLRAHRS